MRSNDPPFTRGDEVERPARTSLTTTLVDAVEVMAPIEAGLVSLDAVSRSREFAVRLALGASPGEIQKSALLRAGGRALLGVTLGVVLAIAASRALGSLLFGVDPLDAWTYAGVTTLVLGAVVLASYLATRRIGFIQPMDLLRHE